MTDRQAAEAALARALPELSIPTPDCPHDEAACGVCERQFADEDDAATILDRLLAHPADARAVAAALVPDSLDVERLRRSFEFIEALVRRRDPTFWPKVAADYAREPTCGSRWCVGRLQYEDCRADSLDALRLRRIEEAAWDVVRRTGGLTVHFTGGMPYLVVKPDWTDALAAALREGREP